MSDRDWRVWERRLRAAPGDQDVLQAAIAARRRSQLPVPAWMLRQEVHAGRPFELAARVDLSARLTDGRVVGLGRTGGGEALSLPEHHLCWVQPVDCSPAALRELVPQLVAAGVSGLALKADVRDAGLAELAPLASTLTYLDLSGCSEISAAGLAALAPLQQLATLKLWRCPLRELGALGALRGLSTLDLGGCAGVDAGVLAQLAGLSELSVLNLGGCQGVDDAALAELAPLERLTALDLRRCRAIERGAEPLSRLSELTLLNLSFCTRLEAESLGALNGLPHLSWLYLLGSGVSELLAQQQLGPLRARCQVVL